MAKEHTFRECVYGVIKETGRELTEDELWGLTPMYKSGGVVTIGLVEDYFDRRKTNLATHYKYCPYCGKELDFKKMKKVAENYG